MGVIRLARRHTLIHELSGIETLARVDVLCVDKTGTITENEMRAELPELLPGAGCPAGEMARLVGMYVLRIGDDNPTAQALGKAFPADTLPREWAEARTIPFSSERKWSAVRLDDTLAYVLGAPDLLLRFLPEERPAGRESGEGPVQCRKTRGAAGPPRRADGGGYLIRHPWNRWR